jgi:adiponectin receptor
MVIESFEEPILSTSTARQTLLHSARRRRHSSFNPLSCQAEPDELQLLVCFEFNQLCIPLTRLQVESFLSELNRRLDFLESYGHLNLDSSIERAWETLQAVRDSCSRVSSEFMDAGRRKARVLVEVLEDGYNDALERKETLEQKVLEGLRLMESLLADYEARAYDLKENGFGSAYQLLDEGRNKVNEGLEMAKEVVDEGFDLARRAAESIEAAAEAALAKARIQGLLSVHDLPAPWRINEHIIGGYRFHPSLMGCVRSVFSISNEFVNIWSHFLGLMLVLSIAFYFYPTSVHFSLSTKTDVFIAGLFFAAACKCLLCSTIWHTFNSVAKQRLVEKFACVDYTGISVLIAASIMTTEYTAFYCEPFWRWFWMSTTACFGIAGTLLPWNPTFNRYELAWLRVSFYVGLASTGFMPVIQLMFARGFFWALIFYSPIFKSLAVYLVGAILYAKQIPERWCPGMFDYVGGSHNIWHLAVLAGIFFHYLAMQEFFAKAFIRAFMQCSVY